ncbi:histidine phosphatase family protein [Microbacterium sp. No. 7]|uniref:histidine phosphatase family protein n=1 Tax=Microbacterium sp. No. 7 TaxID=1714373 RepID=UPI0006CF7CC2|nr:histidine phosphatase family protein [Microbacterium sp. No. 7]ALJ18959.1 hypothetical protein AOA12_03170 [Microbacterium sp. No. 7]
MRLLLIRHAQTPNNVTGALDTAYPGAGLTELGLRQAAAIPDALAPGAIPDALAPGGIAAIAVSPLVRTGLTAAPLAERLGVDARVQHGFEEILAGDWEMSREWAAVAAYRAALLAWADGDLAHALPGAPDGADFLARFDAAVHATVSPLNDDETAVVVSHGAAIRAWVTLRTGTSLVRGTSMPNTGMAVLEGDPDAGWALRDYVGRPIGGIHLDGGHAHDALLDVTPHTGG